MKQLERGGKDIEKLLFVIDKLAEGERLAPNYRDHPLKGGFEGKRDCHVEDDWILLYSLERDELILYRTGTHP
uniref:mRNA interferase YafQ n=1 Tax=Candidatus Kentrum sp. FM TaxID=2126340 RepID=A0A450TV55_9GAMM|nr:MAG: mRNA interferase YafQ [Candidatus Kentron sp. FM]VFJ72916.1 MAG: mRNA interferase YafQ [Candidatus Kentron sp. FM]VFK19356.1 MAG: mRNA interferase YafQ [Candidatus Kentron sp. FM]